MSEWYVQKKKPLKFDVDTMHLFKNKNKKHLKIRHSSYFKIYSFLYYRSYILLSQ